MADTTWFPFSDGIFALALVDTEAAGYSDNWMAPSGLTANVVTLDSYDMPDGTSWYCQMTSGKLTSRKNTTTRNRSATFCNPASTTSSPSESSWTLDAGWAQDNHVAQGLSRFMFEHDAAEAYFALGLSGSNPPIAIGRVYLQAGEFGGDAGSDLVTSVSMDLPRKPSIEFGNASESEVVD